MRLSSTPRAQCTAQHAVSHGTITQAILADVVSALQRCHTVGVLHRDCRPSNILINDGRSILSDFGCSCMAPEDFMGAPRELWSDHLLDGKLFRKQDDLHIFVRSLYALRSALPRPSAMLQEVKEFWATRGMFHDFFI